MHQSFNVPVDAHRNQQFWPQMLLLLSQCRISCSLKKEPLFFELHPKTRCFCRSCTKVKCRKSIWALISVWWLFFTNKNTIIEQTFGFFLFFPAFFCPPAPRMNDYYSRGRSQSSNFVCTGGSVLAPVLRVAALLPRYVFVWVSGGTRTTHPPHPPHHCSHTRAAQNTRAYGMISELKYRPPINHRLQGWVTRHRWLEADVHEAMSRARRAKRRDGCSAHNKRRVTT